MQTLVVLPYPQVTYEPCNISSTTLVSSVVPQPEFECEGIIWPDPGFPSLVVPYGVTSDFLPSGHIGYLTIATLELYKIGVRRRPLLVLSVVSIFYEAFVLLVTRNHYSVDFIVGIVQASWSWILAGLVCKQWVDR